MNSDRLKSGKIHEKWVGSFTSKFNEIIYFACTGWYAE